VVPLMVMMLWMGVASPGFLRKVDGATERILRQASSGRYRVERIEPQRHKGREGHKAGILRDPSGPGVLVVKNR
ncbi:MAG: hypothetical protein NTZ98_15790, partial [Acidobacteria bacterium]|nr:hypothetical protein [Acidobacteriota bacterium]